MTASRDSQPTCFTEGGRKRKVSYLSKRDGKQALKTLESKFGDEGLCVYLCGCKFYHVGHPSEKATTEEIPHDDHQTTS